jgi:predicted esterase
LTLRRPFEGRTTAQVLRAIAAEEAPFPRRLDPIVPRDLETICLTALEKDPARRYASACEMARDLERFLAYQPVRARPLSLPRRVSRFVRRHPARAAALFLAALLFVGLPVGLSLANAAIRAQRDLAALSAEAARRQVARNAHQIDFLVELFDMAGAALSPLPPLDGEPQSAADVLSRSAERIDAQFEEEPLVRAALLEATGRVFADLGMHQRALYQLDRSFAILHGELGPHHPDVAAALEGLAAVHMAEGNAPAAEALARRALAALTGAATGDPALELEARRTLSDALVAQGRPREATAVLIDAPPGGTGEARAKIEERLGRLAAERGEPLEARARLSAALALREAALDPDLLEVAHSLEALADATAQAGDLARAADLRRRAGELCESWSARPAWASEDLTGAGPAAGGRAELFRRFLLLPEWIADFDRTFQEGITALQSGHPRDALELFGRCHAWQPERPACAYNIACAHALQGQTAAALDWLDRAVELGFGADDVGWAALHKDPDLGSIRGEERLARLIERLQALRRGLEGELAEPAYRAPRSPRPEPWPLLVVLHAHGEDGAAVLAGPWAQAADELGCALLAPSAPLSAGGDLASGRKWFEDARELVEQPNRHGQRILDLVDEALQRQELDRERVFLAGAGEAAPLAFDLALRAPGRFRGVLLVDGTILPEVALDRCRRAAAFGLAVRVSIGGPEHLAGQPGPDALAQHAVDVEDWLARRGLDARVELHGRGAPPAQDLARSLSALLEGSAAVLR